MEDSGYVTIVITVPESHANAVREAMGKAGAGRVGTYSHCSYSVKGVGRFIPNKDSNPYIGKEGVLQEVVEERIETVCNRSVLHDVLEEIKKAHPYEETVIDIYPVYEIGRKKAKENITSPPIPNVYKNLVLERSDFQTDLKAQNENDCFDPSVKWKHAWENEYQKKGIPSSFKSTPARVVTEFYSWLEQRNFKGSRAADLGCGRGRNSFYLASKGFSVTALDLLQENADYVKQQADSMKLPIESRAQNIASPWPIATNSLDIAIDIFCYKHITNKNGQKSYRRELERTLKPTGYYFISLASENDGFYGPLLANSPNPNHKLVLDPYAKIESYLYSISDLIQEFGDRFTVVEATEQESLSPMHGKQYKRKVLNLILKKLALHK